MYTSNSEFDLETRVQITNEVPIERTYQQMHHSLQNDTWKWLIGEEDVNYDLPVGGKYIEGVDADGNSEIREVVAPPVKIVNGKQAAVYGPTKSQKWNPDTESYEEYTPNYHRIEITGTLSSEHDLFLHEIYRYLNCIYPDHPDWLNLLTRNEVLDAFNNAAAMVDYKPNNEFFKLVADSIGDVDGSEEFKLNLRNLSSNAARRKFFGSTLGYRMVGHDAYEDIMVFPVGKNLTIAPMKGTETEDGLKPSGIAVKNYIIDTFDERYQTLFRRIDFNGNSRDTAFVSNNSVMLPSYTLPGFEDFVFEFVSSKNGYSTLQDYTLYNNNDYSFFTNHNENIVGSIAGLKQYDVLEAKLTTIDDGSYVNYVSSDDKIYGYQLSVLTRPSYLKLLKYKSFDELEEFQKEHNIVNIRDWDMSFKNGIGNKDKLFFSEYLRPIYNYCAGFESLKDYSSIHSYVDFIYNPFIKNTIILHPEEMIKLYGETRFNKGVVVNVPSPTLSGTSLEVGDFISFENSGLKNTTTYEVCGASWGTLEANFHNEHSIKIYTEIKSFDPFDEFDNSIYTDDNSVVIVENRDGDYIILHGSLRCYWGYMSDSYYSASYLKSIKFVIKAIPETKSEQIFRVLYGDECFNLVNEITAELTENNKDLNRARLLIQNVEATLTDTPLETYEELSIKESLTTEEQATLKAAIAKLEEFAYSYWSDYKDAEEKIRDNTKDLVAAQDEIARLKKNKELVVKDDILTIGYDCKIVYLGNVGDNGIYGKYTFLTDNGFIDKINLGNISVLPIDPKSNAIPLERNYVSESFETTYTLAQIDLNSLTKELSQTSQLYSNILDDDRAVAFTSTLKFEIYNEKTFTVTAQVFVDKKTNQPTYEMQFITDDAKKKFESISVGSKVRGPGIGNAYVTSVGDNSVTLNTSIPKGGYLTYSFECPVTTTPSDVKDDPFNYKRMMNELGIYDKVSFFDHGVYGTKEWPDISTVVFNGDLRDKQILNPTTFRQVVKYLYGDKLTDKENNYLVPSITKYTRDIFVDVKADKLIGSKNHNGHIGNLMNVEWLDYIQNNGDLALAKENINVGANIIMNTDLSGYASLIKDAEYTDEKLKILFQTNNWDSTTIPAYVQVGTGGSSLKSFFKVLSDIYYPNVYGATFWDQDIEPTYAGKAKDTINDWRTVGETKLKKRSVYSKVNTIADASSIYKTYENIDNPLFEIPLNEYNIQLKTYQNEKAYTVIDALFYEQGFKNITKKNELKIAESAELYSNFIDAYPSVSSLDASIADKIKYYYFADGSKENEEKGEFWFTTRLDANNKNNAKSGVKNGRFDKYDILNGGVFGGSLYYFNAVFYNILGAGFYSDVDLQQLKLNAETDEAIAAFLKEDPKEILRRLLILKAYYNMGYIENAISYKTDLIHNKTDFMNTFLDSFENKLILFTYIKGKWDYLKDENGKIIAATESNQIGGNLDSNDELDETLPDFFGLKTYDVVGLLWNGTDIELVNINKNYTITSISIPPLPLLTKTEENLFYGYFREPIFTNYSKLRINRKQDESQQSNKDNVWLAVNHDLSSWEANLSNSFINYSYNIFNIITLPRKYIANGSYNIDLFIDPQFIGEGYDYDKYLKGDRTIERFNISQSAIRYDKDNDIFYTIAAPYDGVNLADENKKIVIKFEEQRYFKDLKFLFGSYQTSNTQFEGANNITKEAYIKGVALQPFSISDLSTSDKFISVTEVDLRSIYTPLLNSRIFQGTRNFSGEVYGITDNGEYFVSGKRTQPFSRIYDKDVTTALRDILPATTDENGNINILDNYASGVDFNTVTTLAAPTYETVTIRKSIDPRYVVSNVPEFTYYKNLLIFEGLINLKKANAIEAPEGDSSTFNSVLQMLNSGDTIEGAVALSGGSYATHTITTNIEERAKFVAVNGSDVTIITPSGVWKNDDTINFDAINSASFSKVAGIPELSDPVTNVVWDEDEEAFIATVGRNPTNTPNDPDPFGLTYYQSTVAIALKPVPDNEQPVEVYASKFSSNLSDQFIERNDGINIYKAEKVAVGKIVNQGSFIETENVNPNDVAFRVYSEIENDEGTEGKEKEIYGESYLDNGKHLVVEEGPYIPRDPKDGEQIRRSLYSTDDIDIALIQEYMFVKTKSYLVDNKGNYTRQLSTNRHWKVAKLPEILDNTELSLKSHTLTGSNSVYNYVKNVYSTFAGWAFNNSLIVNGETEGEVTFAGNSLSEAYKREDIIYFRDAVKDYMENHFLDFNQFKSKCSFFDKDGKVTSFVSEGVTIDVDVKNYTNITTPLIRVECDTGLPLDEKFRIDKTANYKISGTTLDFVIQSKATQNYVNFDEMYYQYATITMKYLIGEVISENFGTACITDVRSAGNKLCFKTFNDDFFFIEKDKLYKYSDFSNMANWKTALMPAGTYLRGSYEKTINNFHTVTVKGSDGQNVIIPVSAKTIPIKFFRLRTDMYVAPDGKHIFFGGYVVPIPEIKNAIRLGGGSDSDLMNDTLMEASVNTWMNNETNKGKAPMILYSDDAGETFKVLPIKSYVDSSLFSNDNYEVASFKEYEDKLLAFVKKTNGGFESSQIVISFSSATGDVDVESTEYKPMAIADNGNIHTIPAGDGTITWTDGALGFGVDIDASQMTGSNSLNLDYTGPNSLTIPAGLVVKSTTSGSILLNKGFASGTMTGGKLRALFAISTKMDVPIQAQFLTSDVAKLTEYRNRSTGLFKVPTTKRVDNESLANRIYSSRYLNAIDTASLSEGGETIGYPRVDEDINKIYYEYDVDDDGKVGDVLPLENTFGNEIKLCDEDGSHYIFDNEVASPSMPQRLEDMIEADLDVSFAQTAGKNKSSAQSALTDISTMDIDSNLTYDDNNDYYSYVLKSFNTSDNSAIIKPSYDPKEKAALIEFDNGELLSEDVTELNTFITSVEGAWGSTDNTYGSFEERFTLKEVQKADKVTYALYDNKYKCYVLKTRRYIDGLFIVPYMFYNGGNGISVVADPQIEYKDDENESIATLVGDGRYASGIYYHPMGYGGLRNNKSITNNTPWDRDSVAFENKLLKNALGNYVYLTDAMGNKLDVYNSIKISDGTEIVKYDDFLESGYNTIRFGSTLEECYKESSETNFFKLYKLNETKFHQAHSLDTITKGTNIKLRVYNNVEACTFVAGKYDIYQVDTTNPVGSITIKENGDATVSDNFEGEGNVYFDAEVLYSIANGKSESDFVRIILNSAQDIALANVTIIYEKAVIFHKSDSNYMTITKLTENGNSKVQGKFVIKDKDDKFLTKDNIECTTSASITQDENVIVVDFVLGMTEYKEVALTYNGITIYKFPIFTIDDDIFVAKDNNDKDTYYLGDAKLDTSNPEYESFKNNINNFPVTKIVNATPLTYGMEISIKNIEKGNIIIIGLKGPSISKAPKYKNLSDLIYYEGVFIYKDVTCDSNCVQKMKIESVAEDYSSVKLQSPLTGSLEKYNDDNEHYFLFKILTIAHQATKPENMNDPSHYYELDLSEMTTYPPDRVWYNSKGSPKPPVKVGNKIFNSENNYAYYSDEYVNANNFKIRLCDREGHYINYDANGNEYRLDDGDDGDCSKYVYTGVDGRYVSPKPVNATCQEWYKNNIWSKNKEVNPLWQIINIKPIIKNKKWVQNVTLNKYTKSGDNQVMTTNIDYPYITIKDITRTYVKDDILYYISQAENFDIEKGELQLLLSDGSDYYKNNEEITMYGLHFTPELFIKNLKDAKAQSTLQASYTVNTLRDFSTSVQENNTIAEITELGIFDKNHKLIAYANFPPVEYRTDTQHAAFTCVIYHGNMVLNEEN